MSSTWGDGLRLAWGTLSAIPVPPPRRVDREVAGAAMTLAPLAALPLAVAWTAWAWLGTALALPDLVVGGLAVALLTLMTRAMHLDGLADYADGLSASYDRERALAVMKTGDVGPSGAAAIASCLLVQAACLASLAGSARGVVLGAVALLLSRHLLAWACVRGVPSARPGGLGDMVAGTVPVWRAAAVLVLVTALGAAGCVAIGAARSWWAVLPCAAAGLVGGWLVVERAVRRLGGITGDVLGATIEVALTLALVAATACG
ncbi:adenosylcobinamide-GDP ribazoletransferase [Arsenicicoccus dermatophilus]|uniref:adenosylcobinamide-GDP ribazoletransferase n=1 Tax=Arsenicicoccus dermatophilus TaxID=1076331 RepID=UPI001F4CD11F|nr:adenosylcobinamide-GDP ribazoletransferase [Arsenicicoccus dermatophilus]